MYFQPGEGPSRKPIVKPMDRFIALSPGAHLPGHQERGPAAGGRGAADANGAGHRDAGHRGQKRQCQWSASTYRHRCWEHWK